MLGAFLNGVLEAASLWSSIRGLALLAVGVYALSALALWRQRPASQPGTAPERFQTALP